MNGLNLLIGLPDDVTYNILRYIEAPNNIASILCHSMVPLCHATKEYVDANDNLWEAILSGYYVNNYDGDNGDGGRKGSKCTKSDRAFRARTQRRSSKRLRRTTAKEDVIHAHFVLRDQVRESMKVLISLLFHLKSHTLSFYSLIEEGMFSNVFNVLLL